MTSGRPPSVDYVARQLAGTGLPHSVLVDLARQAIAATGPAQVVEVAAAAAEAFGRRLMRPVINATGVLLHTNLGRAPLDLDHPTSYSNLEYDLVAGARGDRSGPTSDLLARVTGAEAALVVNNGAAAVLLVLAAIAPGREVVVSRGELVEIGGGFRIPDVLAQSGARLVEVGTTNRTRPDDYRRAVGPETAAVLKVHQSNFTIQGFTEAVGVASLAGLGPPVVADLGSGLLDERCPWLTGGPPSWLRAEPGVRQTLDAGAALVTFSGDKLLGGPQAGIIAGRRDLVDLCRRHPLARALRPGQIVLEALQRVVLAYLRRDAGEIVPLWRLALTPVSDLITRAERIGVGKVVDCDSVMGGGTLPGAVIPSVGLDLDGGAAAALRNQDPPVIARVADSRTVCDLRTVLEEQDELLAAALHRLG